MLQVPHTARGRASLGSWVGHTLRRGGKWKDSWNTWPHTVSHCGSSACSVCSTPHQQQISSVGSIPGRTVGGPPSGHVTGPYGDLNARWCARPGKMGTRRSEQRHWRQRLPAADDGLARDTGPRVGCAPHMGRLRVSTVGRRDKGSPIATGTGTAATPGRQEHPRAGGPTSRGRACRGCPRQSVSSRPEACMAGCSSRQSQAARTHSWRRAFCRLWQRKITSTSRGRTERPREVRAPWARGTEGPAAKKPEPLARVLLSRRVH